jgi:hypothetical protein
MNKDDITFSIIGLVLGLVVGFFVANSLSTSKPAPAPAPMQSQTNPADLPEGHPPINGSEPTEAGPLPSGAGESSPHAAGPVSMPSLEPLPASDKRQKAEQKHKNIQVLKGVAADDFQNIMFGFQKSLGVECTYCHIKDQFERDDKPTKLAARKMIMRVRAINKDNLGGKVNCYTCHRGQVEPPH